MLEIRRITAEETQMTSKIETVVFNMRNDFSKEKEDEFADPAHWKWAAFEDGRMISSMIELPFLMRFDGHSVKMSGIGGVGTLPEARKGGAIRKIFEKLLPEAYESEVMFSNLTPFSHKFYRQFGYALCCARNEVRIPVKEFDSVKMRGRFVQFFPGDDTSVLQRIHAAYIRDINHAICRDYWPDNRAWRLFTKDDPYKTGTFLYVWHDEKSDEPRAYIKYKHVHEGDENNMSILELAFMDRDAMYGAMSLFGVLSAQYRNCVWMMPTFLEPTDFVDHVWRIDQKIVPRDMTRVIDVKAALASMRKPEGEGAFVLQVKDPILAANSDRFLVEYGEGETKVGPTQKGADIACDMPVVSQLITGYRTLGNALCTCREGIEVYGNEKTLDKVFTLRPQHITEAF